MRDCILKIYQRTSLVPLMALGMFLLFSCENSMKDIEKVANIQEEENVNISRDVTVVYSDSAVVKAELKSPELREYPDSVGFFEFQKGVVIRFFDANQNETQRIKSDYAIQRNNEGLTEFRKNVVVTMDNGSIIKSEEIFYDEKKQIYYNTVPITFDMKDGRGSFQATSFTSDLNFKLIKGENMTGYYVPTGENQLPSFGR